MYVCMYGSCDVRYVYRRAGLSRERFRFNRAIENLVCVVLFERI